MEAAATNSSHYPQHQVLHQAHPTLCIQQPLQQAQQLQQATSQQLHIQQQQHRLVQPVPLSHPPQLKRQKQHGPGEGTTFLDMVKAGGGELALRIMKCFPSGSYFKDNDFKACFALYSTCRALRQCPAVNQNITTLRWWLDSKSPSTGYRPAKMKKQPLQPPEQQDEPKQQNGGQPKQHGGQQAASGCDSSHGAEGENDGAVEGADNKVQELMLAPHQRWPKNAPPVKVMHIGTTYQSIVGVQEQRQLLMGLCTMVRAQAAHSKHGILRNLHTLWLSVSGMMWDDTLAGVLWCNLAHSIRQFEMWSDARCLCSAGFIRHLALLPHLQHLELDEQVVITDVNQCHGPMPPVVLQQQVQKGSGQQAQTQEEPSRQEHPQQQQQLQEMGPQEQQQLQRQQEQQGQQEEEAAKHDKYQCGVPPSLLAHLYQLKVLKVCLHARPGCLMNLSGLKNLEVLCMHGVLSTDGVVHLDALTSLTKLRELTLSPWLESEHEAPWEGQQQVHVETLAQLTSLTLLAVHGWGQSCWDMVLHGLDTVAHPFNRLTRFEVSGIVRLPESCGDVYWPVLQDVEIAGDVPMATMTKLTQNLPIHHVQRLLSRFINS